MCGESEWTGKEAVMAYFKVLNANIFLVGLMKIMKNIS
jgi:hypothetical protein